MRFFMRRDFVDYARTHAVPIDFSDGMNADIGRLSFLDDLLRDKRIVALGEEDHWIHEKVDYRIALLRYLFSRGFRTVCEELGWSDGLRVDRFVQTGDKTWLSRIATYGYRGERRADRPVYGAGILHDTIDEQSVSSFAAEQMRFASFLRDANLGLAQDERIRFYGFDINAEPNAGYADIAELIGGVEASPALRSVQALLARVPGESADEEIDRLQSLGDAIDAFTDELTDSLGKERFALLRQSVLTMADSMKYFRMANDAADYSCLGEAMALRESVMCRHVLSVSDLIGERKLVLLGHNRHLCKRSDRIRNNAMAAPGGTSGVSVGTALNELLPGRLFTVWFLNRTGMSAHPMRSLSREYMPRRGSLNEALSEAGNSYLLVTGSGDPRARLLEKYVDIVGIYSAAFRARLAEQADAVAFVESVTPDRA